MRALGRGEELAGDSELAALMAVQATTHGKLNRELGKVARLTVSMSPFKVGSETA